MLFESEVDNNNLKNNTSNNDNGDLTVTDVKDISTDIDIEKKKKDKVYSNNNDNSDNNSNNNSDFSNNNNLNYNNISKSKGRSEVNKRKATEIIMEPNSNKKISINECDHVVDTGIEKDEIKVKRMGKANSKTVAFGNRTLDDASKVLTQNAWDKVEMSEEKILEAQEKILTQKQNPVSEENKIKFESEAGENWNKFYGLHDKKFFKHRNWLFSEFPELEKIESEQTFRVFEIGCGVGNTIIPLLKCNPNPKLFVYGCDISENAVKILNTSAELDKSRSKVFVHDISVPILNNEGEEIEISGNDGEVVPNIENGTLDICTLIFVLSAICPENMQRVICKIAKLLKPGGKLLLRDYGRYDLAQLRFKKERHLRDNFYVRGDGTMVYFFTKEEIEDMMTKAGLICNQLEFDKKLIVNRKTQQQMYRVWLQCKYTKPL